MKAKKRGPREGFQVALHVPALLHELELNDREKLFCSFIYMLHKGRGRGKNRQGNDILHMADNDFKNFLGWRLCNTDINGFLEPLRQVFNIAQAGGYWRIQWTDRALDYKLTQRRSIPGWSWLYIEDPHAIALHYYLTAMATQREMLSDWYEGQDMNEFYREPILRRTEYNLLKFRKSLYINDAHS